MSLRIALAVFLAACVAGASNPPAKERIVSGRITETDGRAVQGALVQVTEAVFREHQPYVEPPRTMTDADGRFVLHGVPDRSSGTPMRPDSIRAPIYRRTGASSRSSFSCSPA